MADQSPRHLVLLPAMLCDEDLYRAQIAALGDLVESLPLVVAEAGMAESAAAVLRRAPPRFVLAGTSYGASLALEVAVTAPRRVLGLLLMGCNPGPHGHPEAASRLGGRVEAGEFEAVVEELAQRTVYGRGPNGLVAGAVFRRMARRLGPAVFLQQNATLLGRHDRRGNLAGINCPTLLIWGREDDFAEIAHGSLMASRMPRAKLVVLDDCGHLPPIEQPAAVTDAVRTWLRQVQAEHEQLARLLQALPDADWSRQGRHPSLGVMSIEFLARRVGEHAEEHAAQIAEATATGRAGGTRTGD